jgi:hypothetical protein
VPNRAFPGRQPYFLNVSDRADEPPLAPVAAPAALPPAGAGRPRWHTPLLVVLVLAGIAGLAVGGFALHAELTRHATAAEAAAAGRAEITTRWERLPAGQLFPATISYVSAGQQRTTAQRVGIAPAASCAAALDPAAAAIFHARGCQTVLRASYTDASGSLTVTVGVVVMRSTTAAQSAVSDLAIQPGHAGVRAVSFPGTRAAGYGDAQRGWFHAEGGNGPYAFLYAAGFTDGRRGTGDLTTEPTALGSGVLSRLITVLTAGRPPCSRADIQC